MCRSNICWATEEFGACRFIFQSALAINGNIAAPGPTRVADAHLLLDACARQFCLPVSTESIPFRTTTPPNITASCWCNPCPVMASTAPVLVQKRAPLPVRYCSSTADRFRSLSRRSPENLWKFNKLAFTLDPAQGYWRARRTRCG